MNKKEILQKKNYLLIVIVLFSLLLNIFIVPHFHRWYTDESNAIEKAKTIITGEEYSQIKFRHPIGWSLLLSFIFLIFGLSTNIALYTSSIIGGLTVINIFIIAYLITKNRKTALFSAFIYSLIPTVLTYTGSAVNNTASTFFLTLTIWIILSSYDVDSKKIRILTIALIGITALFRTENYYLFVFYFLGLLLFKKKKKIIYHSIKVSIIVLLLLLPMLITNLNLYLNNSLAIGNVGDSSISNWNFTNFLRNQETFEGLVSNNLHPLLFTVLYLIGIYIGIKTQRRKSIFLLLWIIPLIISFSLYFHTPPRFLIGIYPVLAVFAGIAINYIIELFKNKNKFIQLIIGLIVFTSFFSYLQSIQTDIWVPHSLETKIPDMIKYDLKENCTIIAPQPTTLKETTTNIEVISATAFIDKTKIPKNKCVLFYEDIYCHGIFHKIPECSFIKNNYQYSVYKEYSYDYKDESTTYKLYLLKLEN